MSTLSVLANPSDGLCIICDFMVNYINKLSITEYKRLGLFSCCKCIQEYDHYKHELCDYIGTDHQQCVGIYSFKSSRHIQKDGKEVWNICDIRDVLIHYTNDDKQKADELLNTFLTENCALVMKD